MTTVDEPNVHVFAGDRPFAIYIFKTHPLYPHLYIHNHVITSCSVDGTSDDLDIPIREVFKDTEFVSKHNICSINSINWARILVQIAHHFFAYFKVC